MRASSSLLRRALRIWGKMSRMEMAPSRKDRARVAGLLMETILAGQGVMWMMPIFSAGRPRDLGRMVRRILAAISRGGSIGRIWPQRVG